MQTHRAVLVVAAETLVRAGLAACLDAPPFAVVKAAATAADAEEALRTLRPPLMVLIADDPPLPDAAPTEAWERLVTGHPGTRALVLLRHPDSASVWLACRQGARGVCQTSLDPKQLRETLAQVDTGELVIQQALLPHLVAARGDEEAVAPRRLLLTGRELRALHLLAQGLTADEMARELETTVNGVDQLIRRAMHRLGATHRAHAVSVAFRSGLIA